MTKRDMLNLLNVMVKHRHTPQGTRLVKIHCPECGFIARTTNKWLGAMPVCSSCDTFFEVA